MWHFSISVTPEQWSQPRGSLQWTSYKIRSLILSKMCLEPQGSSHTFRFLPLTLFIQWPGRCSLLEISHINVDMRADEAMHLIEFSTVNFEWMKTSYSGLRYVVYNWIVLIISDRIFHFRHVLNLFSFSPRVAENGSVSTFEMSKQNIDCNSADVFPVYIYFYVILQRYNPIL